MKKQFLLLAVSAIVASNAFSQSTPKLAIKAGFAAANFSISGNTTEMGEKPSGRPAFYAGATLNFPLSEVWSVQPGLILTGKGVKEKESYSETSGGVTSSYAIDAKLSPLYLEVPLNITAGFDLGIGKFILGAGPYYAIGIAGKYKYKLNASQTSEQGYSAMGADENSDIKFGNTEDSHLKRGDYGVNALSAYQLKNGLAIQVGYSIGLGNIAIDRGVDVKTHNRVFTAGLAFEF